jgi:hypothetical protein
MLEGRVEHCSHHVQFRRWGEVKLAFAVQVLLEMLLRVVHGR